VKHDPDKHRRRSIRLKNYDYTHVGAYFVTICTSNRECLFGEIAGGEMRLNEWGKVVGEEWTCSSDIRKEIELDEFVVMPNHMHGIVIISDVVGAHGRAPLQKNEIKRFYRRPRSLSSFIAGFKSAVTKHINERRGTLGISVWQRNYYEHIIRSETALNTIRRYIRYNPSMWLHDEDNPASRRLAPEPRKRLLSGVYGFSEEESEFIVSHGIEYRSCQ
jgi:REP element-mobilizing transposase RayT